MVPVLVPGLPWCRMDGRRVRAVMPGCSGSRGGISGRRCLPLGCEGLSSLPVALLGVPLLPFPTAGRTLTWRAGILFTTASSRTLFTVSHSFNPVCLACLVAWPPALGFSWFPSPMTVAQLAAELTLPAPRLAPSRLGAGHRWTQAVAFGCTPF